MGWRDYSPVVRIMPETAPCGHNFKIERKQNFVDPKECKVRRIEDLERRPPYDIINVYRGRWGRREEVSAWVEWSLDTFNTMQEAHDFLAEYGRSDEKYRIVKSWPVRIKPPLKRVKIGD